MTQSDAVAAKLFLAFAIIYVVWGSTYLAIRYAVESVPPFLMMGIRHLIAGSLLFVWGRSRDKTRITREQWLQAAVLGCLFFLGGHGLLAWGQQRVASGIAALLMASEPFWLVLLDWQWGRGGRPTGRIVLGLTLGFAGIGLLVGSGLFSGEGGLDFWGGTAVIAGGISWAVGAVYSRNIERPPSNRVSAAMQLIAGGGLLVLFGGVIGEPARVGPEAFSSRALLSLAYLIIFGSLISFTAYSWLLRTTSLARIATHTYVNPLVAMFLGWYLGAEPLTLNSLAASAVIVTGVVLVVTVPDTAPDRPNVEARAKI